MEKRAQFQNKRNWYEAEAKQMLMGAQDCGSRGRSRPLTTKGDEIVSFIYETKTEGSPLESWSSPILLSFIYLCILVMDITTTTTTSYEGQCQVSLLNMGLSLAFVKIG